MILFQKTYDGDSIYDVPGDVIEVFDIKFTPELGDIPVDEYGIQQGTFVVKIEWLEEK
jgi:hypothetical protein